eukprot:gene10811-10967_t
MLQHRKTNSLEYAAVEIRISSATFSAEGHKAPAGDESAAEQSAATAAAEDEWQAASQERLREVLKLGKLLPDNSSPSLSHQECLPYPATQDLLLSAADLRSHRAAVLQSLPPQRSWLLRQLWRLTACWPGDIGLMIQGPESVAVGGLEQEQLVQLLSLARLRLNNDDAGHVAVLQAVYITLTGIGRQGGVPRYGRHWADLGFQGDDPASDLRGVGMLGLLQLRYLTHHNAEAAHKLYRLSHSDLQEFPLAIVSLNITRWALMALRAGALLRAARRLGSYILAANHFYCGAFYEFYARWRQGKTMREAGFVLKQLEEYCRHHTEKLLELAAAPDQAMLRAGQHA